MTERNCASLAHEPKKGSGLSLTVVVFVLPRVKITSTHMAPFLLYAMRQSHFLPVGSMVIFCSILRILNNTSVAGTEGSVRGCHGSCTQCLCTCARWGARSRAHVAMKPRAPLYTDLWSAIHLGQFGTPSKRWSLRDKKWSSNFSHSDLLLFSAPFPGFFTVGALIQAQPRSPSVATHVIVGNVDQEDVRYSRSLGGCVAKTLILTQLRA